MSQIFFEQLKLPKPDYINEVIKGRHGQETAAMLAFLEDVLMAERPQVTVVYGDVNSTLAGALASAKLRIPVAHVEAGIRSPFRFNPEEINRRMTDAASDVLFPNIREAYDALLREGYAAADVHLVGDIVRDSLDIVLRERGIAVRRGPYLVATVHREENTDSPERLRAILEGLGRCGRTVVLPLHPRTRKRMTEFGLFPLVERSASIDVRETMGYVEFVELLAGADKVLTDSGSVRREAYLLGKPVIGLIDIVWVPSMVACGWKRIAGADADAIVEAVRTHEPTAARPDLFGDGRAAERIVQVLRERYG
jgi:UDP-N-acetylglucosamine 2-epimerase